MKFFVSCGHVVNFHDFVDVMNKGFIDRIGGHWSGSLDAFNDYLGWPDEPYELVLENASMLPRVLGERSGDRSLWEVLQEIFADNTEFCTLVLS